MWFKSKSALGDSTPAEVKRVTIQHILDAVTKYYQAPVPLP